MVIDLSADGLGESRPLAIRTDDQPGADVLRPPRGIPGADAGDPAALDQRFDEADTFAKLAPAATAASASIGSNRYRRDA